MDEIGKEVTQKEMLNLFDAVSGDIWLYGKRSPEICKAIRKLIEQSGEVDEELIDDIIFIAEHEDVEYDSKCRQIKQLLQSKRTVTREEIKKAWLKHIPRGIAEVPVWNAFALKDAIFDFIGEFVEVEDGKVNKG